MSPDPTFRHVVLGSKLEVIWNADGVPKLSSLDKISVETHAWGTANKDGDVFAPEAIDKMNSLFHRYSSGDIKGILVNRMNDHTIFTIGDGRVGDSGVVFTKMYSGNKVDRVTIRVNRARESSLHISLSEGTYIDTALVIPDPMLIDNIITNIEKCDIQAVLDGIWMVFDAVPCTVVVKSVGKAEWSNLTAGKKA